MTAVLESPVADPGVAPDCFFVPDLIQLGVPRGSRVVVVSDLHLAPAASDVSTRAADELAELLNGFHEPGMLVIAGDGFEMLAAAPDVAAILDSHPQFTGAVKRFAADKDHRVVLTPGNHDGQLAWDGDSVAVLRDRLGVTDVALACDLAVETGEGTQLVRVMHGHQFDQYNAFDDPRSPVDTPLGHHVVRQVLPKFASRDQPGSLPGREHRGTGAARARAFGRARAIFDRYGGGTLDYFALRDDKSWLFSGNTLIAYSVINRVMLVSPDPIGPVDERLDAWSDAMDLADTNGWYISVLGASAPWLPIYRAAGLTAVYMGDEAAAGARRSPSTPARSCPPGLSVVRLRITKPDAPRPFKIPGGKPGLALVTGAGVVGALFTFVLGLIPASHLSLTGTTTYVAVMAFGMIAIIGTPFLLHRGPSIKVDAQADPSLLGSAASLGPAASGEKALV
jgi:UDP-2,3-diacylglucosamine pyrophosphatase LpxH